MSQVKSLIKHMEKASITPLEALKKYGVFRLASRVHRIKQMGYDVLCAWEYVNNGKKCKSYWLNPTKKVKR